MVLYYQSLLTKSKGNTKMVFGSQYKRYIILHERCMFLKILKEGRFKKYFNDCSN